MAAVGVPLLVLLATSAGGVRVPAEDDIGTTGVLTADCQINWGCVANQIEALAPNDFAGAMIRDGQYVIGFKGAIPPAAAKLLAQFSVAYVAMTDLGFSWQDVEALSESIVETVLHNAPGVSMEVDPGALSPQITVSVDPTTLPDINPGVLDTAGGITPNRLAAGVSVDMSSATLTAQESRRVQAVASVLTVPSGSTLQIVVVPCTIDMPVFVTASE